jgi:hypothetical protein
MKHIASIICGVSLISVFIVIFFFTYASRIEQKIVQERCAEIVNDLTAGLESIPKPYKSFLYTQIGPYLTVPPSLESADAQVVEQNKNLLKKSAIFAGSFLVLSFIAVFILSRIFEFSFLGILKTNLIILVFVGITEFSFLTFFAQNYITIDSNFVKETVLKTVGDFKG